MSYIYNPTINPDFFYKGVQPQGVKKTIFADQSARTSIYNRKSRAKNTVENSYGGYYVKNENERNSVNMSLWRVRGGGSAVPFKSRKVTPF